MLSVLKEELKKNPSHMRGVRNTQHSSSLPITVDYIIKLKIKQFIINIEKENSRTCIYKKKTEKIEAQRVANCAQRRDTWSPSHTRGVRNNKALFIFANYYIIWNSKLNTINSWKLMKLHMRRRRRRSGGFAYYPD